MRKATFFFSLLVAFSLAACTGTQQPEPISSDKVVVTIEQRFDYLTWKIQAANGIWHFEIEHAETGEPSTGFNSAIDREGNDWIANDCVGMHEWRGWPNFAADGFCHPCRGGNGKSQWIDTNGNPIEFQDRLEGDHLILEVWNDDFKLRYHFFPTFASIEVLQADEMYAFLWEGPPAGKMAHHKQHYVLQDGIERDFPLHTPYCYLEPEFGRHFPSPYFYFVDHDAQPIVYVGVRDKSDGGDEGWIQPGNMVIFSFGREAGDVALTGTDAISVFGFLDKDMGHEAIDVFIKARLEDPFAYGK